MLLLLCTWYRLRRPPKGCYRGHGDGDSAVVPVGSGFTTTASDRHRGRRSIYVIPLPLYLYRGWIPHPLYYRPTGMTGWSPPPFLRSCIKNGCCGQSLVRCHKCVHGVMYNQCETQMLSFTMPALSTGPRPRFLHVLTSQKADVDADEGLPNNLTGLRFRAASPEAKGLKPPSCPPARHPCP